MARSRATTAHSPARGRAPRRVPSCGASALRLRVKSSMLESIELRGRCRSSTTEMPTALSSTTDSRYHTSAALRLGDDRTDVVGTERPVVAARPVLLLPDRDRLLERVDAEAGRLERLPAMRRR